MLKFLDCFLSKGSNKEFTINIPWYKSIAVGTSNLNKVTSGINEVINGRYEQQTVMR